MGIGEPVALQDDLVGQLNDTDFALALEMVQLDDIDVSDSVTVNLIVELITKCPNLTRVALLFMGHHHHSRPVSSHNNDVNYRFKLTNALRHHTMPNLQVLKICVTEPNGHNDDLFQAICSILGKHESSIKHLFIQESQISFQGATALAAAIKSKSLFLETLEIQVCGIHTLGLLSILHSALRDNETLTWFHVMKIHPTAPSCANAIGKALAECLSSNHTLEWLSMHLMKFPTVLWQLWEERIAWQNTAIVKMEFWNYNTCCNITNRVNINNEVNTWVDENRRFRQDFVAATNLAEGAALLPILVAKTDRVAMKYNYLRTRVDLVVSGLLERQS